MYLGPYKFIISVTGYSIFYRVSIDPKMNQGTLQSNCNESIKYCSVVYSCADKEWFHDYSDIPFNSSKLAMKSLDDRLRILHGYQFLSEEQFLKLQILI